MSAPFPTENAVFAFWAGSLWWPEIGVSAFSLTNSAALPEINGVDVEYVCQSLSRFLISAECCRELFQRGSGRALHKTALRLSQVAALAFPLLLANIRDSECADLAEILAAASEIEPSTFRLLEDIQTPSEVDAPASISA